MTGKNMQNAEKPTKDTRQYKHTPRPSKRLTSKIFALVACLLLMVTFTIPTFAYTSTTDGTLPNVLYASPYNPVAFGTNLYTNNVERFAIYDLDYCNAWNYTLNPSITSTIAQPINVPVSSVLTKNSDQTGALTITPPSTPLQNASLALVSFYWHDFTFNEEWASYIPDITLNYTNDTYVAYVYTIRYVEIGAKPDQNGIVQKQKTGTIYVDYNDSQHDVVNLRELIRRSTALDNPYVYVSSLALDCIPKVDYEGTENNADATFVSAAISFKYRNGDQPEGSFYYDPPTATPPEVVIPEPVEPSGLFDWLADSLNGVLTTPLLPIGEYSISIGSVLGMFLGISLVIAFLKFFAGG